MPSSNTPAPDAVTFSVAAALEAYQQNAEELARTWLDMERYEALSKEVDRLKLFCASVPDLSVPLVRVLMAHTQLVHCLWQLGHGPWQEQDQPDVERCLAEHREAVEALHSKCILLLKGRR